MPRLSKYLNDLLENGTYSFTITAIEYHTNDSREFGSLWYKGRVALYEGGEKPLTIFRSLNPVVAGIIGSDLLKFGVSRGDEVPGIDDENGEELADFMQQFVGGSYDVVVTKYTDKQGEERNRFKVKGLSSESALV